MKTTYFLETFGLEEGVLDFRAVESLYLFTLWYVK